MMKTFLEEVGIAVGLLVTVYSLMWTLQVPKLDDWRWALGVLLLVLFAEFYGFAERVRARRRK